MTNATPPVTRLGTVISAPAAPKIDIEVSNGGGGPGDTALVTVHVTWDATAMSFGRVVDPTARSTMTSASCTWSDYGIAWASRKTFSFDLYRKAGLTGPTNVIATCTDTRSGDYSTKSWLVPANHPQEP